MISDSRFCKSLFSFKKEATRQTLCLAHDNDSVTSKDIVHPQYLPTPQHNIITHHHLYTHPGNVQKTSIILISLHNGTVILQMKHINILSTVTAQTHEQVNVHLQMPSIVLGNSRKYPSGIIAVHKEAPCM